MKLLERFFGSPSERDLLQEAEDYRKKEKRTKYEVRIVDQAGLISRRQFLWRGGVTAVTGLVLASGIRAILLSQEHEERADLLTDKPESFTWWNGGSGSSYDASASSKSGIDEEYVTALFDKLSADRDADPNKKLKAVLDNASIVRPKDRSSFGSAVRICESGYFITVAHNFFELNPNEVNTVPRRKGGYEIFNPASGAYSTVRAVLLAANEDLAIAYAPTTSPRRAPDGLKLNFNFPAKGKKLWNVAITPDQGGLVLGIAGGRVWQNSPELFFRSDSIRSKSVLIEGLKPYGGSSGCATVNSLGEVVAIEQGSYQDKELENQRRNYTAAEVGPLSSLREREKRKFYVFADITS